MSITTNTIFIIILTIIIIIIIIIIIQIYKSTDRPSVPVLQAH